MELRIDVSLVLYETPPELTRRALAGLSDSDHGIGTIWVHINGDGGSVEKPPELSGCNVTRSARNLGFAGAHNGLLARAFADGADIVVAHNPDLTLAPAALGALAAEAQRHPGRLLGPVLERAEAGGARTGLVDSLGIRWTRDCRHLDDRQGRPLTVAPTALPRRVQGVSGACLAVPRGAYDRIVAASGEFFDADFIAYREDAELALRASILGVQSWLVPAARGLHIRTQRGTSRGSKPQVDLLGVRNRFLIAFKWGHRRPGWLPLVLVRDATVICAVLLKERSSLPGLVQAWQLRGVMRAKRRRVLAAVAATERSTS